MEGVRERTERNASLQRITAQIEELRVHLLEWSALANAHMTDFFTCEHWQTVVPHNWQRELLPLTDAELVGENECFHWVEI